MDAISQPLSKKSIFTKIWQGYPQDNFDPNGDRIVYWFDLALLHDLVMMVVVNEMATITI